MKMSMYQLEYTFLRFLSVEKRSCMLNIIHVDFPQKQGTSNLHFVSSKGTWGIGFESQRESLHV